MQLRRATDRNESNESLQPRPAASIRASTRRGFLGTLGAAGLAAAAMAFKSPLPVAAGDWECCNLVYAPPNMSFSACQACNDYTWYCNGGNLTCYCCECYAQNGSAGQCEVCC
jgi:hypothetical protein